MSLLSVRNLSLSIGSFEVLKSVHLDIAPGEIVAITGESGSGKSMTALATLGLAPATARITGEILFEAENLLTLSETQICAIRGDRIGMVFQEPMTALNPVQTIGAQVSETLRLHRPDADAEAEAAQILTRVGLPQDRFPLTRYPHELSGGQRQRVWIAMALAQDTELLLLDEPTTFLDITHQVEVLDLVARLNRQRGRTVVMVLHDLNLACRYAHHLVAMRAGEIVTAGRPAEVITAETVRSVFGLDCIVVDDPVTGTPLVVPAAPR